MRRTLLLGIALWWLPGCVTLYQALYDTSKAVAPPHPVYGTPVFNVVPEAQEVAQASSPPPRLRRECLHVRRRHGRGIRRPLRRDGRTER
jgi:hypothetical protein